MKQPAIIVILLILVAPVFGQVTAKDSVSGSDQRLFQPGRPDYHVSLGSQFTTVSGFGSALTTFVTPRISYNLTKRLSIGGGISIVRTNYFNTRSYFQSDQAGHDGNFTSAMVFVSGQYLVSERLSIAGSAYKQFPLGRDPLPYNPFSPVSSLGTQGINFDLGYKIGDHIYIQAGFRYSEGRNPWITDPYQHSPFLDDPYGHQPFGRPRW